MKIISERQKITRIEYSRDFLDDDQNGGYSFSCDRNGNLLPNTSEEALKNYQDCIEGKHPDLYDKGIVEWECNYTEPAIGICDICGKEVILNVDYCGAVECECGQWYNLFGQKLNPPEMWEEPIDYDY